MKWFGKTDSRDRRTVNTPPGIDLEIAAEAAAWIAHLHGPNRTPESQQRFQAWQARSPAHREAFERCTDVWQEVALSGATAFRNQPEYRPPSAPRTSTRWRAGARVWTTAIVGAPTCALALVLALHWQGTHTYLTHVGEQRVVMLDDGSRMTMNTDTKLRVDFGQKQRSVAIEQGEAFFEVAKDSTRPFVVRIADSEVVAVGTAFSVRYAPTGRATGQLAVTLVEGHVKVRSAGGANPAALEPSSPVLMNPGEQLFLEQAASQKVVPVLRKLDQPRVASALAWKRGEVVFDDTPLAEAITDMNRYSHITISLSDDVAAANLHISGLYLVDDVAGFAEAVAAMHGLTMRKAEGRLELVKRR